MGDESDPNTNERATVRFVVTNASDDPARVELLRHGRASMGFKISFVKKKSEDLEKRYLVGESKESVDMGTNNLVLFQEEIKERPMLSTFVSAIEKYSVSAKPNDPEGAENEKPAHKMGTIMGVYLPCCQNILGVILFVRLTWIVGLAGIGQSLLIVFLCCCTTLLTAISMSAIATNGVVPGGGSYFMISRALGPELGGAVGILFYLGTTFASSMYILGAVEILLKYIAPPLVLFGDIVGPENKGNLLNNYRIYGSSFLFLMSTLVFFGVKWVNRAASVFLACVVISIVSIFAGVLITAVNPPVQEVCMLGNRLIEFGGDGLCLKGNFSAANFTKDNITSLDSTYCKFNLSEAINVSSRVCDPYYEQNEVHTVLGIPGIASNVSKANGGPAYSSKGDLIVAPDQDEVKTLDPPENFNPPPATYPTWLTADITTSFTVLLAIFFPSVTGIMAGSNRSGDLKDAQRSIPTGTIGAVLTTGVIYLLSVVFFGSCVEGILLRDKFGDSIGGELIVALLAWPNKWIVLIGAFLSTVGAGLQSLVGAPRLLQAIAKDNIIPFLKVFGRGKKNGDPTWSLLLTVLISLIGVIIADLEKVAPIITMFFLMCYAFVNVACALQTLLRTPGWRPRFKYYHWFLSFVGMGLCVSLMFISSWIYTIVAFVLALSIHKYIEYSGAKKEWGDGLRGLQLTTARYALLRLEEGMIHTKNWRPQLLILIKANEDLEPKHPMMLCLADQLKAGKGLTMVSTVLAGNPIEIYPEANKCQEELQIAMQECKIKGFARCIVCPSVTAGISSVIQSSGLGGLRHNTIMMGWPYKWRSKPDGAGYNTFLSTLKIASALNLAVIVPKNIMHFPRSTEKLRGTIDVWWIVHDGGLLMLLPFLLRQHKAWKACKMRIFTVAQLEDNSIQLKKNLEDFIYKLRIDAEIEVVEMQTSDISAYTYERTLLMEQRTEFLQQLKQQRETFDSGAGTSQSVFNPENEMTWMPDTLKMAKLKVNTDKTDELSKIRSKTTIPMREKEDLSHANDMNNLAPKSNNVRRMHTAVKLNETIVNRSHQAQLVILNLPGPPKKEDSNREANYMEFLEVLTEGLPRVMMVRGGGREVITMYS